MKFISKIAKDKFNFCEKTAKLLQANRFNWRWTWNQPWAKFCLLWLLVRDQIWVKTSQALDAIGEDGKSGCRFISIWDPRCSSGAHRKLSGQWSKPILCLQWDPTWAKLPTATLFARRQNITIRSKVYQFWEETRDATLDSASMHFGLIWTCNNS